MATQKFEDRAHGIRGGGLSIPPIESSDAFRARIAREEACLRLAAPAGVRASPFSWVSPKKIPRRQWLYGRHYIRKFVTVTIAPGGYGKSTLTITVISTYRRCSGCGRATGRVSSPHSATTPWSRAANRRSPSRHVTGVSRSRSAEASRSGCTAPTTGRRAA
jgi:AAA domain